MWRHRLKPLRVVGALLIGGLLAASLLDFRGLLPSRLAHALASIQLVPAAVAWVTDASVVALVILLMIVGTTLLFGRVYCSVVCPLGILQDVMARMAGWWRRRPARLSYRRAPNALRYGFLGLTLAGIAAGWGGLTLALLDPYSNFGRIASGVFRPVLTLLNNAAVSVTSRLGMDWLYRVKPWWPGLAVTGLALAVLLLVGVLAARRGRLFCNTVCPVGTFLGLLSRRAAFRITLERTACVKCGECLQACKAQCIDLREGKVDASRCVACFNCISSCRELGITYALAWRPAPAEADEVVTEPAGEPEPEPSATASNLETGPANPARRAFINGAVIAAVAGVSADLGGAEAAEEAPPDPNRSLAVCPPGARSIDRYLSRCTACHLCVSACPTHVLQPAFLEYGFAGLLRPRLDFTKSFCNYDCRECGEVCPDGAIALLDLADKQLTRVAKAIFVQHLCVVEKDGTDCAACSEHCPTKAVDTKPYKNGLRIPVLHPERCIGCGACEYACPVQPEKAIKVEGRRRHERAEKAPVAAPAVAAPSDGFPF